MTRPSTWAGLAVIALALAAWILQPSALAVDLAHAERGPMVVTVLEEGRTRVRDRFVVHAPAPGALARITLEPGDLVQSGRTIVATLSPPVAAPLDDRARIEAKGRLGRAEAAHQLAQDELRRMRGMAERELVATAELERAIEREAVTRQERETAERHYSSGRIRPTHEAMPVYAPAGGRVLRVFEKSARFVPAGTPLLEIGDPTHLEVEIELLSQDGVRVPRAGRIELHGWGGPEPLQARVRRIEPYATTKVSALGVEEQRVRVIADILEPMDERPHLGDGYRVEAHVILWSGEDVLQVPIGALVHRSASWSVFIVDNGHARERLVQIGHRSSQVAEIRSGLSVGTPVILYPGNAIAEGVRVAERTGGSRE